MGNSTDLLTVFFSCYRPAVKQLSSSNSLQQYRQSKAVFFVIAAEDTTSELAVSTQLFILKKLRNIPCSKPFGIAKFNVASIVILLLIGMKHMGI